MLTLLASGKLLKDPMRRTSQNGNTYATALLSVAIDDGQVLVSAIAFGECAEKLLKLGKDDALAVLGKAKLSAWERNSEPKQGLDLVVDKVLSVYELGKKRDALSELRRTAAAPPASKRLDDPIPF